MGTDPPGHDSRVYEHWRRPAPAGRARADRGNENVDSPPPRVRLTLQTQFAPELNYHAVSKLPTPLVAQAPFGFRARSGGSPAADPSGATMRPDNEAAAAAGSRSGHPPLPDAPRSVSSSLADGPSYGSSELFRSDSLRLPKRQERSPIALHRSGSVGSPQRKPTTVLHREVGLGAITEQPPEEVYLATDTDGRQTAWEKVRLFGKGSFSEVILARPAKDYVAPGRAAEIEATVAQELQKLDSAVETRFTPRALVAVKVTQLTHKDHDTQMHLFNRDLEILSNMPKNPCLVSMIGFSIDQEMYKRVFFVLPLYCGGDLFDMVSQNRSKMAVHLIRRIFADVCAATVFLHEHDIVHRDIKLENVLLALKKNALLSFGSEIMAYTGPIAVLTDLGLARRIDASNPTLTTRCGSDDYVPPEIILGQPYDGRETDSWALGVLLYAVMEGRLPFDPPPHSRSEGARQGLKTAHRIARLDWSWYKRKDSSDFDGGKEVVEQCLQRRGQRRLARDTLKMPWVWDARPGEVHGLQSTRSITDMFAEQAC